MLPRLLMALPESEVVAAAAHLAGQYRLEDLTLPQAGLGLMQLEDGALGEAYYLGEVPLATAHVMLTDAAGNRFEGAARIMHDNPALAQAIAVIDAVVSARLPESETVESMLRRGLALLAEKSAARKKMLARTKVDFSLLGSAEEEDGDE